jgi:hypothetical protein
MDHINQKCIYDSCSVILKSYTDKFVKSLHSSIWFLVCHEYNRKSNERIKTKIYHSLFMKKLKAKPVRVDINQAIESDVYSTMQNAG